MKNDLNNTPKSNRIHISIFGRRNSGKSSMINALANQEVAIVSDTPGTTTDPVYKSIEIKGLGPCVIVDTAGFDDGDKNLGKLRIEKTRNITKKTDIALLVFDASASYDNYNLEEEWKNYFIEIETPVIAVVNKIDFTNYSVEISKKINNILKIDTVCVSAKNRENIELLIETIVKNTPKEDEISITGHLIKSDDIVMLIMPQDIQAPKGRLILPQVQTIRDILDNKAIVIASTFDKLEKALEALSKPPKIIITDSQVFKEVDKIKPKESMLTSFSVLFARYKGNEKIYREGALSIDKLTKESRVLIAESCTHIPLEGDIGRIKIPNLLRKKTGENIKIDVVSGNDFPKDLSPYDLIIQCGGCMSTRKYILNRIRASSLQKVPITNYGMAIAKLTKTDYV